MDSLVLQTVIGLVFVFAIFAAFVAILTETISRYIGLRGEYLLRGLRTLLDGEGDFKLGVTDLMRRKSPGLGEPGGPLPPPTPPSLSAPPAPATAPAIPMSPAAAAAKASMAQEPLVTLILHSALLSPLADKGKMPRYAGNAKLSVADRRRLPSYISGQNAARAILGFFVPDPAGKTTMDDIRTQLDAIGPTPGTEALKRLATQAGDSLADFRRGIEIWYDDHMDRVSGWYKRHVRWISVVIGVALVLVFNLNAVSIASSLYTDEGLRGSVLSQAVDAAECGTKEPADCLRDVRAEIREIRSGGLAIGWGVVPACAESEACGWADARGLTDPTGSGIADLMFFLVVLVGWALMVVALLPGARFWFDALARLGSLRSTGPKPTRTT